MSKFKFSKGIPQTFMSAIGALFGGIGLSRRSYRPKYNPPKVGVATTQIERHPDLVEDLKYAAQVKRDRKQAKRRGIATVMTGREFLAAQYKATGDE